MNAPVMPAHESAVAVFGAGSRLVEAPLPESAGIVASPFFSVALLVCLVGWCLLMWAYREYALAAFGIVRGGVVTEKLLDRRDKLFGAFLNWAAVLGCIALGLAVVHTPGEVGFSGGDFQTTAIVAGDSLEDALGALATWGVIGLIWAVQWGLLAVAGKLTLYTEFTQKLFYIRRIIAATATVAAIPLFLLHSLSGAIWLGVALWVLGTGLSSLLIIRGFVLFMRQRFSILLWILYLCGVEILPVLTAVIVAGKLRP